MGRRIFIRENATGRGTAKTVFDLTGAISSWFLLLLPCFKQWAG